MRLLALAICALTSACALPPLPEQEGETLARAEVLVYPKRVFPQGVARSNAHLARDFLDLTFALENGKRLPRLLRHQGPVKVALRTDNLRRFERDLDQLLHRIREEAEIDISRTEDVEAAQIHITGVTAREIDRAFPGAACFVSPGVRTWTEYRRAGRSRPWSQQERLDQMAIFVPIDTATQETRDCLHEELAQALGPANDLYHLSDTIFNDDNDHGILTPFDMLMLRVLYSDEMANGLTRAEAQARLGTLLRRINPKGRIASRPRAGAQSGWDAEIKRAFDRRLNLRQRVIAAENAVRIAADMLPQDHRLGVALITRGRLVERRAPARAETDFAAAHAVMRQVTGAKSVRTAKAALYLARARLRAGDPGEATRLVNAALPPAKAAQDAILVSGLYLIQAEAARAQDDTQAARAAEIASLQWARLGFGDRDGRILAAQIELKGLIRPKKEP